MAAVMYGSLFVMIYTACILVKGDLTMTEIVVALIGVGGVLIGNLITNIAGWKKPEMK